MTEFGVWAPERDRIRLRLGSGSRSDADIVAMSRSEDGWWRADVAGAVAGTDYAFLIDDDDKGYPDPRSRWQPGGVHEASRIYDHDEFRWTDHGWTGRALPGAVIYELHVGTFTPEGTFDAAIDRLDHLADLGVDFVELLPLNAFNGDHGWGYDGVGWYAPHEPYGGPDGLKRFVDACHASGLAVLIDAVYNHFGPSGAYAPMFAPVLSSGANDWGQSLNLDGHHSDGVRRFVIDSALAWLRDYHADGLRLDAVHTLVDHSATHLLEQMAAEVDALATHLGRPLSLIAESDRNDVRLVTSRDAHGYGLTAQWDDDIHHALHALLTGERQGYYDDFGEISGLAKVWREAFFHNGTYSTFRGRRHGRPIDRATTPGYRFIAYVQDHDQIGNRAAGDRLTATLSPALLRVAAVLLFTSPFTPMLFMGDEWAASTPWQYFTGHPEPELGAAVANGRRAEFARHGWRPEDVPDPQDPATFSRSKLDWDELELREHAEMLTVYRQLIALRRRYPELSDPRLDRVDVTYGEHHVVIHRGRCLVVANLGSEPVTVDVPGNGVETLYATSADANTGSTPVRLPAEAAAVVRLV
ncbi:MAG TPA: malto-oligosyltrehalose trehalohydrolase [Micromonosporaceae bacterium]|nr:malto-oligosyltrehalose trehalohydrolase [Micromonosporaceae bacterium]